MDESSSADTFEAAAEALLSVWVGGENGRGVANGWRKRVKRRQQQQQRQQRLSTTILKAQINRSTLETVGCRFSSNRETGRGRSSVQPSPLPPILLSLSVWEWSKPMRRPQKKNNNNKNTTLSFSHHALHLVSTSLFKRVPVTALNLDRTPSEGVSHLEMRFSTPHLWSLACPPASSSCP